ncbi:MAG: OB-fold domain-containing protein [Flavobacteriales bacterium]
MITHVKGKILEKNTSYMIVYVHGLGYLVKISFNIYFQLPNTEEVQLYNHLLIIDNQHVLYVFTDMDDREMFRHLIAPSVVYNLGWLCSFIFPQFRRGRPSCCLQTFKRRRYQDGLMDPYRTQGQYKNKEALNALDVLIFTQKKTEKNKRYIGPIT